MTRKELSMIIVVVFLGIAEILAVSMMIWFVAIIISLMMGMLLGASVVRNEVGLERWARKKLEEQHV